MRVQLRNVRIAFPQLFEPKAFGDGDPAFSASFLMPPDHAAVKELEAAIQAAADEKWGAKSKEVLKGLKAADKTCLHNGDSKGEYDGFAGNMFVSARSKTAPKVLDRKKNILLPRDGIPYGGCYVNALLDVWAQDNDFGKRVNATLAGVQFVRDGDAFGSGRPASEDEFDDLGDDDDDLLGEPV